MNMKEALTVKAEEVFDLYSRGLLAVFYNSAWEDVMKIIKSYKDIKPIHIFANENNATIRFAADQRGKWVATIRPKIGSANATILSGETYQDCEFKVRKILEKGGERWWLNRFINQSRPTTNKGEIK